MLVKSQLDHLSNTLKVILASQSPRRQELLRDVIGVKNFKIFVSHFAEDLDKAQFETPAAYCVATTMGKAKDILERLSDEKDQWDVIICADTIVVSESASGGLSSFEILEKPSDAQHCFEMIKQLQGKKHTVITSLVLVVKNTAAAVGEGGQEEEDKERGHTFVTHVESTHVTMAPLCDAQITDYALTESAWRGKAGGYGIQDAAAKFITGIEGDYYTVMGLPVHQLAKLLAENIQYGGGAPTSNSLADGL